MKRFLSILAAILFLTGSFSVATAYAAPTGTTPIPSGTNLQSIGAPAGSAYMNCIPSSGCTYYDTNSRYLGLTNYQSNGEVDFTNSAGQQSTLVTATQAAAANQSGSLVQALENFGSCLATSPVGVLSLGGTCIPAAINGATTGGTGSGSASCSSLTDITGFVSFFSCLGSDPSALFALLLQGFFDLLYWVIFALVWLSAELLDFCANQLVVQMGTFVDSTSASGIQAAWQIMRDLANIGIIGGLVAIAISTILQIEKYRANKFLAQLIIAALLVNFSYFFAGAIIDASNYLATVVYTDMTQSVTGCTAQSPCSITWDFMQVTNFQKLHDDLTSSNGTNLTGGINQEQSNTTGTVAAPSSTKNIGPWMTLLVDILSVVFELVTIFVFLSAVALLIGRFVSLVFLLITSPVGIAGSAIPGVAKYAKEWWNILFAQAFFAPVYFLLLDFSFRVLSVAKNGILLGGAQAAGTQTLGIILTFIITSAFMLMSLRVAKQMSDVGKQYLGDIYKGANALAGWMPKAYTGMLKTTGGALGTESLGRFSDTALDRYNKMMARQPTTMLGRGLRAITPDKFIKKGLETVSKAKFGGDESFLEARARRIGRRGELDLVRERQKAEKAMDAAVPAADAADAKYKDLVHQGGERDGPQTAEEILAAEAEERKKRGEPERDATDEEKKNAETQAALNRETRAAYADYMTKQAKVDAALSILPPESFDYYKTRGDYGRLIKMSRSLSSVTAARLIKDKELPKEVRDKMLQARYGKILDFYQEGRALEEKMKAGTATDEEKGRYKTLQRALYNEFKRGGIDSKDFEMLFTQHPDMLSSEFLVDGGIPSGFYQVVQDSGELGTAQKWLAKETRRTSPKRVLKQGDAAYAAGDEEGFLQAVEEEEGKLAGKQPHEVVREYGDQMVSSPTFAAAVGSDAFFGLFGKKDQVYLQNMVDNVVQLYNSGAGTPEQRKRWASIIAGIRDGQTDAAVGYQSLLLRAEAKDKAKGGKGTVVITPEDQGGDEGAPPATPPAPRTPTRPSSPTPSGGGGTGETSSGESAEAKPVTTPPAPPVQDPAQAAPSGEEPTEGDKTPPPPVAGETEPEPQAPQTAAGDGQVASYEGQEADRAQEDIVADSLGMIAGGGTSALPGQRARIKDALGRLTNPRALIDFALRHPNLVTHPEFIRALTPRQFDFLYAWEGLRRDQKQEMTRIRTEDPQL